MSEQSPQAPKGPSDPKMAKAIEDEVKQFRKMCPEDQVPVLTILRAHLLTEHYLERLIAATLPRGDVVLEAGLLSYAQKLNVVEGLAVLPDMIVQCLKGLNRVRNNCAHEMERDITIPDVERIGRPLGAEFTSLRQKHYPDVKALLNAVVFCVMRDLSFKVFIRERDSAKTHESK